MLLRRILPSFRPAVNVRFLSTEVTASSIVPIASTRLSAFTGKPQFYEALFFFDDILLKLQPLDKTLTKTSGQSIKWHDRQQLGDALGFSLSTLQYRKIRDKLVDLACYSGLAEVRNFLQNFTEDPAVQAMPLTAINEPCATKPTIKSIYGLVDSLGRVVAKGKRKTSTAKVYLVEGEGLFYVNGKPAAEYFSRVSDMFKIAEPFRVTSTFGKFNVWALVRGGGFTGSNLKRELVFIGCRPVRSSGSCHGQGSRSQGWVLSSNSLSMYDPMYRTCVDIIDKWRGRSLGSPRPASASPGSSVN
jgi:small subunit ribosomal protein S9